MMFKMISKFLYSRKFGGQTTTKDTQAVVILIITCCVTYL